MAGQNDAKVIDGPLVLNGGKTVYYVVDNVLLPPQAAIDSVMASITPNADPPIVSSKSPPPASPIVSSENTCS